MTQLSNYLWYVRLFFWNQKRRYGQILKPALQWGHTPKVFSALALLYGALDRKKSPIEPSLRSLITVRVSQLNWCEFCIDINSMMVLRRGNSQQKLDELANFRDSDYFTAREKVALSYAEAITLSERQVQPIDRDELKQHFSDDAIIELTAVIAFQNMSSKFNAALDVSAQGFCQLKQAEAVQGDSR